MTKKPWKVVVLDAQEHGVAKTVAFPFAERPTDAEKRRCVERAGGKREPRVTFRGEEVR